MPVITRPSTELNKTAYSNQSVEDNYMKYSKNVELEISSLLDEHAALNYKIQELRDWWLQLHELGQPHFGEMADRISAFRDLLAVHFCHEENASDLPLVQQLSSDKVYQIAELRDEHDQLLSNLQGIIDRLENGQSEYQYWETPKHDLETFFDRLSAHEAAEEAVLESLTHEESI